ncbi:phosphotransferase family protein [Nocardioides sp. AE5]|uniref:phosphotransferase family protein n=1 Tax=Nocardioides sp. AE5 TaxID=2962573 RepID=UPI0028819B0B|nr:phosphotransferase family protein [Nocardioides sp. AE5]MDT0202626.1 phosphotransferase family protein [Nocardioides sp. AE5]
MNSPVDLGALANWMDTHGLGSGPVRIKDRLGGGTQNVMLRLVRDGREFIFRRGPEHLRPKTNAAIAREIRVLTALGSTDVPHPRVIASCPDPEVLGGAVFYLMEPIDGYNPTVKSPPNDRERLRCLAFSAVDAVATLGTVDHEAIGLGDFGRPQGFLERQVPQWLAHLDSFAEFEDYPGHGFSGIAEVAAWLEGNRPAHWAPGIMHGDFHLANVMCSPKDHRVAAIVDWEMATIGDPLLDLGWLVATWPWPGQPSVFGEPSQVLGTAVTAEELVARYQEISGRDVAQWRWYVALAAFKLGIVMEGTHARAHGGLVDAELGQKMHHGAQAMIHRARRAVHATTEEG